MSSWFAVGLLVHTFFRSKGHEYTVAAHLRAVAPNVTVNKPPFSCNKKFPNAALKCAVMVLNAHHIKLVPTNIFDTPAPLKN